MHLAVSPPSAASAASRAPTAILVSISTTRNLVVKLERPESPQPSSKMTHCIAVPLPSRFVRNATVANVCTAWRRPLRPRSSKAASVIDVTQCAAKGPSSGLNRIAMSPKAMMALLMTNSSPVRIFASKAEAHVPAISASRRRKWAMGPRSATTDFSRITPSLFCSPASHNARTASECPSTHADSSTDTAVKSPKLTSCAKPTWVQKAPRSPGARTGAGVVSPTSSGDSAPGRGSKR
mmetsp:Transcript_26826/g.75320  ORF Transcript_26826/g.75320 Transcript_26826/m.75320 type:complete len:237 (-) Transcript_26826:65-775(-)